MALSGILAGVLPLLGVVVGVGLQFLLGRSLEASKQLKVQKAQAYADFFKALALAATKGSSSDAMNSAADAKVRICIYGSPSVVTALSAFEKLGAKVDSDESLTAVTALLREMRRDVTGVAADLDELTLRWVLFGPSRK